MHQSFFGLRFLAFQESPDPQILYATPQIRETIACLHYGIAERKGFMVITGEVGTGKTTLLMSALRWLPADRISLAFVLNPRLEALDFLEFVSADFGIPPRERTKSAMLLQLNLWLIERYRKGGLCVIVVDEAQNLSEGLLEEIGLLANLETGSGKLLQIVLCGQPELEEKLRGRMLRQLRQRIAVWCRTQPLTREETQAYVAERLRIAGAGETVFSPEAVAAVYRHSRGIPRVINLVCEHSMVLADVQQIKPIPSRIVESAVVDLNLQDRPVLISEAALCDSGREMQVVAARNDAVHSIQDTVDSPKEQEI
jgi:general secretion pathway protein A